MAHPTPARRTVVIRTSRDTMVLVASAVAMTFALAYAVHTRPAPVAATPEIVPQKEWVGRLADVSSAPTSVQPTEAMTSASLVVPTAALTLPTQPRPAAAKARSCEASPCPPKIVAALPPSRPKPAPVTTALPITTAALASADAGSVKSEHQDANGTLGKFNPLNHIPDSVRHPFDYAGSTISGWMRRL